MSGLFSKKVVKSPMCPICKSFLESVEHVLFLCPWVKLVWFGIPLNYKIDLAVVTTLDVWLLHVYSHMHLSKLAMKDLMC